MHFASWKPWLLTPRVLRGRTGGGPTVVVHGFGAMFWAFGYLIGFVILLELAATWDAMVLMTFVVIAMYWAMICGIEYVWDHYRARSGRHAANQGTEADQEAGADHR